MEDNVRKIITDKPYLKKTEEVKKLLLDNEYLYQKMDNFFLYKTVYLNIIDIINNNNNNNDNDEEKAAKIIEYITKTSIYNLNNLSEPKMKESVVINRSELYIKQLINQAITDIITGIENIEDIYSKITEKLSDLGIKLDNINQELESQPNMELKTTGKRYIKHLENILKSLNNKLKKDLMIEYIDLKNEDHMLKLMPIGVKDNIRMLDTNYVRKIPNTHTMKKTMDLVNKLKIEDRSIPRPVETSPDIDLNTPTAIFINNSKQNISENRKNITKNKRSYVEKKKIYINNNIIKYLQRLKTSTGVKKYTQEQIINKILMLFSYKKNFDIKNIIHIVEKTISKSNRETKKKSNIPISKRFYSILNSMFNYLYENHYGNYMGDSVDKKIQNIRMQIQDDLEIDDKETDYILDFRKKN